MMQCRALTVLPATHLSSFIRVSFTTAFRIDPRIATFPGHEWHPGRMCGTQYLESTKEKGTGFFKVTERLVLALTNEGDVVLDPFGGVASSVTAAVKHHRVGIMCEWVSQYIQTAKQRLRDYENGALKLRPLGQPIQKSPERGSGISGTVEIKVNPEA